MRRVETIADFGVVVPTKSEHLHWVRGTCASVREFMADTPICIVLDGDAPTSDLRSTYGVVVLHRKDVEPRELCDLSFGSLRTKNTVLWTAPFETYLLVDADAVVWGDMRVHADFDRFDFVLDHGVPADEVRGGIMDVDRVRRHFGDFDASKYAPRYANNGVYFGRRGILDLDRYLDVLRFQRANPGVFYGSQGLLNFMLFSALEEGSVRIEQRELQVTTGGKTRAELARRFPIVDGVPRVEGDPVALHWVSSPKPRVRERGEDYFEPMTHFRLAFRAATRGAPAQTDLACLSLEDMLATDWRGTNLRGRIARLRRRTAQRWARSKVAMRSRTPDHVVAVIKRRSRD